MNDLFKDDKDDKSKKINKISFDNNSISNNFLDNSDIYNSFNQHDFHLSSPLQQHSIENLTENNISFSNEEISSNDKLEDNPEIKIENKINTEKKIPVTLPSTKEIIFKVSKIKKHKKIGRKKKCNFYFHKKPHTNKKKDNIITKIKRKLIKHSIDFINPLLKSKNKIKKIKLKIINNKDSILYNKEKSLALLDMTLKELLSNKLSKKCKRYNEDYNKKKINFIFKIKEEDIIKVFNKTFREILHIYCDDNVENENFKGFKRLNDDIKDFKSKKIEDSYIELYEKTAKNYEKIINEIKSKKKS